MTESNLADGVTYRNQATYKRYDEAVSAAIAGGFTDAANAPEQRDKVCLFKLSDLQMFTAFPLLYLK